MLLVDETAQLDEPSSPPFHAKGLRRSAQDDDQVWKKSDNITCGDYAQSQVDVAHAKCSMRSGQQRPSTSCWRMLQGLGAQPA